MKKLIVITDGTDLRAFRLTSRRGDRGLEFHAEEIRVTFHGSKFHSQDLLEHAVFGEGKTSAHEAETARGHGVGRSPSAAEEIDKKEIDYIAQRIDRIVRAEEPDLWNLVAPPELADEIRDALATGVVEKLTGIRMSDLLGIAVEEVEEHFAPIGARRAGGFPGKPASQLALEFPATP